VPHKGFFGAWRLIAVDSLTPWRVEQVKNVVLADIVQVRLLINKKAHAYFLEGKNWHGIS
jgi:hypothetical protein